MSAVAAAATAVIGYGVSRALAPKQPNMQDVAHQQSQENIEAARQQSLMNNPNIVDPRYTRTFTTGPDGRPIATTTLSPAEQQALESTQALRQSTLTGLQGAMPSLTESLKQPFGLAGGPMMGLDEQYAPAAGDIQKSANLASAGPIQSGLNFSGAPGMPVASDATREAVANAVYRQGARYLDPQFKEQQDAMTTNLANQGITQGTVAAQRAQDAYDRARTLAYGDLGDRATQQGIAAMNTLFGEQLAARQQGVGETIAGGQFANAAQNQGVQQLLAAMTARNNAAQTGANIAGMSTSAFNNARQQAYMEMANNKIMPFNLYSSLMSGAGVNTPNFSGMSPSTVTPGPLMTGAENQARLNAAQASSNNQIVGGLTNAATNYFQKNPLFQSSTAAPIVDQSGGGLPGYEPSPWAFPGST